MGARKAGTARTGTVECRRCGLRVAEEEYRRGKPSHWVSTGRVWIDSPIPVFVHGGPTACHPVPMGMVPNGYWQEGGYWTQATTWAPGRPANEEGCTSCAEILRQADAARAEAKQAKATSDASLQAVIRAAADLDAPLTAPIERYADAVVKHVRWEERRDRLNAEAAAQDKRAAAPSAAARAAVVVARTPPTRAEDDVRSDARARASREAERERAHQRPVEKNRRLYGPLERLTAQHEALERFCQRPKVALHPLVLIAFVAAGVAGAVRLEQAQDWVPTMLEGLRYSEDLRVGASVPLGALLGALGFAAIALVRRRAHRWRVRRACRRAAVLRQRIGCGSKQCPRCPRPESFAVEARFAPSRVGGLLFVGAVGFAIYAAITLGGPLSKLQRLSAVVPDRIGADCRERPNTDSVIELICTGTSVRAIGLNRVYFQYNDVNDLPYGKGIFAAAATFRDCDSWTVSSGLSGAVADCGQEAAAWRDDRVVLGAAIGRRAWEFAQLQHRYGGERVYPR